MFSIHSLVAQPPSCSWYKKVAVLCLVLWTSVPSSSQNFNLSGGVSGMAFGVDEALPFWMYTNTNGSLAEGSSYLVNAFAKAEIPLSRASQLDLVAQGFWHDGFEDAIQRGELYIAFKNEWVTATLGAKNPRVRNAGLSVVDDNVLWSGNSRAIPGLQLESTRPIQLTSFLGVEGSIAHYQLNDNRFVRNTKIHHKSLQFLVDITPNHKVSLGLDHYVQWGGDSPTLGPLRERFSDYVKIFMGASAGEDEANFNERINALGNHIGSYNISYELVNKGLTFYFQNLFEDRSGRELANFPDGIWGAYYQPKANRLVSGILYEYVQTTSQSGSPEFREGMNQQSGGDNYFLNSIYKSGWTYQSATIGLPFIAPLSRNGAPINNRSIAHHLGIMGAIGKVSYQLKGTYLENLGTYTRPINPRDKLIYTYGTFRYSIRNHGDISVLIGGDYGNRKAFTAAIGLGYHYQF